MGKGDKKTKRGKIVIGSSGVRRARKKKKTVAPVTAKVELKVKKEVEERVVPPAKPAPKKAAKKTAAVTGAVEEKPKAARAKKKTAEGDTKTPDE